MPSRKPQTWYRTPNGLLAWYIGVRGCRVTLFETTKGGPFYRRVWKKGGKSTDRASLGTRDREQAVKIAKQLYTALMGGQVAPPVQPAERPAKVEDEVVTLGPLIDLFFEKSARFLDNSEHVRRDMQGRLAIVRAYFGDDKDVILLDENDVYEYQGARRAGGVEYGDGKRTKAVRQRSVQADVKALHQVLNFAANRRVDRRRTLLPSNPLRGCLVAGENDVVRRAATVERYVATRAAMQRMQREHGERADELRDPTRENGPLPHAAAREERYREGWLRAELGLWLLTETGRRRRSVISLRWQDVDFAANQITWRAEFDKKGVTKTVPYARDMMDQLAAFRDRLGGRTEWLFPRQSDPTRPIAPELLSQRLLQAEEAAGLPKLEQTLCHAYRRMWATARTKMPLKARMDAGGWKDPTVLIGCYDQPTDADLLEVTSYGRPALGSNGDQETAGPTAQAA